MPGSTRLSAFVSFRVYWWIVYETAENPIHELTGTHTKIVSNICSLPLAVPHKSRLNSVSIDPNSQGC